MELVKVFTEDFIAVGEDTRDNVHLKGKWHETFHCWLVDEQFVYIQKRSANKKDFPSLYDITAAGHLEADETVEDGVREIEEELGIQVDFSHLKFVGTVQDIIQLPDFYDYEFAHVYLYEGNFKVRDFVLQKEEVEGIYLIKRQDFIALCLEKTTKVDCRHFENETRTEVELAHFVPHEATYFQAIAKALSLAENEKI